MAGGARATRRFHVAPGQASPEAAGGYGGMALEPVTFSAAASQSSASASSAGMALEAAPMSIGAMRIVQGLQERLRKTQRQLRDAERSAEGIHASAQDRGAQCDTLACRHDQLASALQRAQQERWEDLQLEESLLTEIEQCQGELAAARRQRESLVPPAEHEAAQEELDRTRAQLTEAEDEGRDLQRRLSEAETAQRRRDRRFTALAREELERRQSPRNPREALLGKAAELSARVAAESQRKHRARSQERAAQLDGKREQLSQELHRLSRQNVVLEQRLDALRARNRQLEAQQRRAAQAGSEEESTLRAELRRRAMPLRVLTELVRDDSDCFGDDLSAATPCHHELSGFGDLGGVAE